MNTSIKIPPVAHWVFPQRFGYLQIVETDGKEHEILTRLIVQLALRGSFNFIAVDEWLPDRDTLYRLVRRNTIRIEETLDRPKLKRPMTCLQLLDLLAEPEIQNRPTLISNFLYHFYNADVGLSLRDRVIGKCCQYIKNISVYTPVVVFVPRLCTKEYHRFFPILAAVADKIVPIAESIQIEPSQDLLF